MDSLWPWLAVAGSGALHGLNPATGWLPAAACGLGAGGLARVRTLQALVPIAAGHAVSVALVAAVLAFGLALDRRWMGAVAAGLLVAVLLAHCSGGASREPRIPAGRAGLALWSFMMSTAHGAGLMVVPAMAPLCMGSGPAADAASEALLLALAAVGVHTAAMLAVTAVLAAGACRLAERGRVLLRGH